MEWAGASKPDDFYTNDRAKQLFKNHMSYMVNRQNPLTGRLYKEEPTIFAWYGHVPLLKVITMY